MAFFFPGMRVMWRENRSGFAERYYFGTIESARFLEGGKKGIWWLEVLGDHREKNRNPHGIVLGSSVEVISLALPADSA